MGAYTESFDYDELHQLTAENSLISHHYRYDSQGNRLVKDHAAMRIDDNNQLLFDAETHYNYDPNGNIESAETSGSKIRYSYDAFDRLITISSSDQTIRFTYDGIHRRISKTVESNGWSGPKAETTFYLYDNYFEIGSVNASGVIQNLRILGRTPKAETGAAIALEIHGKAYIPLHDIRGSVIALANPTNGKIEESYRYTSFGEEEVYDASNTRLKTSRIGNPWRFASKRIDEETKFICFGRRYYIPKLGRWMTPDPEGYTDGPNLYSFLLNNPLACFDLYGLTALADRNDPNLIDHAARGIRSGFDAVCSAAGQAGSAVVSFAEQAGPEIKHYGREALHYTGEGIYQFSHHLLPPIIKAGGEYIGRLFSKKEHEEHDSQSSPVGVNDPGASTAVTTANGNNNSLNQANRSNQALSQNNDNVRIDGFYSKTHGFLTDVLLCILGQLGIDWGDGKKLAEHWTNLLDSGVTKIIHIAHSRGGIVTKLAMRYMTSEQLKCIKIATFGSPVNIHNVKLAGFQNFASQKDPIPMLSPSYYTGGYTILPSSKKIIEHSIISPTYLTKANQFIEEELISQ